MSIINIVEEDVAVLSAAADYLEIQGFTVHKFGHAETFLRQIPNDENSVSLISFSIGGGRGLSLLKEIVQRRIPTAAIMISEGEATDQIVEAMKLGAMDVLEKPFLPAKLDQALSHAIGTMRKPVTASCVEGFSPPKTNLTGEEDAILVLLSQGCTVKEIAAKLDISVRTVHYRKNSIFEKIGVRNRTEAMAWVAQAQLNSCFQIQC